MNRKLLVALMSGALVLPLGAQGVEIGASGHVNRALIFHDRDDDSVDPVHVNAGSSPSRFRFSGSEEMDNGLTAGANVEYNIGGSANDAPALRHAAVSLGGEFGTVTLGQTGPATHLIAHANFDNYAWLSGVEIGCDFCLGTDAGPTFIAGVAYGASRRPMVKYDTPSLGVANLSFSGDGNDFWDAALRASGEAGVLGYTFHAGFTNYPGTAAVPTAASNQTVRGSDLAMVLEGEDLTADEAGVMAHEEEHGVTLDRLTGDMGSFTDRDLFNKHTPMDPGMAMGEREVVTVAGAVEFGQGTHVNAAWITSDREGADSKEMNHFGVGHNAGNTSIAATFTSSDMGKGGDSWALGIGQLLGEVELYAGYKNLDFDASDAEDYGMFVVGSRVKFN